MTFAYLPLIVAVNGRLSSRRQKTYSLLHKWPRDPPSLSQAECPVEHYNWSVGGMLWTLLTWLPAFPKLLAWLWTQTVVLYQRWLGMEVWFSSRHFPCITWMFLRLWLSCYKGWLWWLCQPMFSHGLCNWYSQPMTRFLHNSYSSRRRPTHRFFLISYIGRRAARSTYSAS